MHFLLASVCFNFIVPSHDIAGTMHPRNLHNNPMNSYIVEMSINVFKPGDKYIVFRR